MSRFTDMFKTGKPKEHNIFELPDEVIGQFDKAGKAKLLEQLGIAQRANHRAYMDHLASNGLPVSMKTYFDGEEMAVSSTPEGMVRFNELYRKISEEFRAFGLPVNEIEKLSLATHTPMEIEEKQRQALDYLKSMWDRRYPPLAQGPFSPPLMAPPPSNLNGGQTMKAPQTAPKQREKANLREEDAYKLLGLRLRLHDGMFLPMQMKIIMGSDKTYLFCLPTTGGPVVLEDDPHLFPSDETIAKLILLMGE